MKKMFLFLFAWLLLINPAYPFSFSLQDPDSLENDKTADVNPVLNNLNHLIVGLGQLNDDNIVSINGSKIAVGSIPANRLESGAGSTTYFVSSTTTTGALTNTSYADLGTMTATQTFGNQTVEIDFECAIAFSSTQTVTFAIAVDGVVKWEFPYGKQADFGTSTLVRFGWTETLTSGSHTIKVQTKTNGSSYTINNRWLKVK